MEMDDFFQFTHHFRDFLGSDISLQLALHMVGYRRAMDRTVAGMHHPDRGIHRFLLYQPLSEFLLVYFPATVLNEQKKNIISNSAFDKEHFA